MKVRINGKCVQVRNKRSYANDTKVVDAQVVKENKKTVWVRLADNNIIKRKKAQIVEA